jgi:hypothetical protein
MRKAEAKKHAYRGIYLILEGQAKIDLSDWAADKFGDDADKVTAAVDEITQHIFHRSHGNMQRARGY